MYKTILVNNIVHTEGITTTGLYKRSRERIDASKEEGRERGRSVPTEVNNINTVDP